MKAPFSWLKKYIDLPETPEALSEILTLSGLEVDKIDGEVFDIALTPNLGHCRSIIGIARELSAQLNRKLTLPSFKLQEDENHLAQSILQVSNKAHHSCPQYCCRIIRGVEVGPSPAWLQEWLTQSGYKSINNVVDVTNFVMHELGQPLHAFDFEKLQNEHIMIREADEGETIITLDGINRSLSEGALVICDGDIPIAIAGIMGGLQSGITENTHTVILEGAEFDHRSIRSTSRSIGLRTESSARFENKINHAGIRFALDRAAALLEEIARGRVLKGIIEQSPKPYMPKFLTCRLSKINSLLGTKFSFGEVESFFSRLSIVSSSDGIDLFQLKIPSWRRDIEHEIDIVEEVARIFGYNNIERSPPNHINSLAPHHPIFLLEREIRNRLVAEGLQEFITCNLISQELCNLEIEHGLFSTEYISVIHAKSVDQSILRPSLLPGLLQTVLHNQNHSNFNIGAFEIGRVHFKEGKDYDEKTVLGIILSGSRDPLTWSKKEVDVDFYDLKGILENLLGALLIKGACMECCSYKTFHPGRQSSLSIANTRFGVFGEVHPETISHLGITGRVYFAEIDLHLIKNYLPKETLFSPLPQFPGSERDWTVTVKESTHLDTFFETLKKIRSPILKNVELLDIYRSEKLGADKKNISLRFFYQDDEKTITIKEVDEEHTSIIAILEKTF
jgi:phenylalanyl-tRNA synthetase beta chain